MNHKEPTLEQRILASLEPERPTTSADLAALIEEAEAAIAKADKERTVEQTLSLDPKAARQAIEDARFRTDRLRILLTRLQARYRQVYEQERVNEYEAKAKILDDESARLAEELSEAYAAVVDKLFNLFARIAAHRERISALHQRRPADVESVRDPELIARNLESFDRDRPSLLTVVQLRDWPNGREKWPPGQPTIGEAFAATMHDRRFTADWANENERRAAAQRAEQKRIADYYRRTTKEQEDRENAEARERFLAQQGQLSVNRPLKS